MKKNSALLRRLGLAMGEHVARTPGASHRFESDSWTECQAVAKATGEQLKRRGFTRVVKEASIDLDTGKQVPARWYTKPARHEDEDDREVVVELSTQHVFVHHQWS